MSEGHYLVGKMTESDGIVRRLEARVKELEAALGSLGVVSVADTLRVIDERDALRARVAELEVEVARLDEEAADLSLDLNRSLAREAMMDERLEAMKIGLQQALALSTAARKEAEALRDRAAGHTPALPDFMVGRSFMAYLLGVIGAHRFTWETGGEEWETT